MSEYELKIAYEEGWQAFHNDFLPSHNPYDGVSEMLEEMWEEGWFDAFEWE